MQRVIILFTYNYFPCHLILKILAYLNNCAYNYDAYYVMTIPVCYIQCSSNITFLFLTGTYATTTATTKLNSDIYL